MLQVHHGYSGVQFGQVPDNGIGVGLFPGMAPPALGDPLRKNLVLHQHGGLFRALVKAPVYGCHGNTQRAGAGEEVWPAVHRGGCQTGFPQTLQQHLAPARGFGDQQHRRLVVLNEVGQPFDGCGTASILLELWRCQESCAYMNRRIRLLTELQYREFAEIGVQFLHRYENRCRRQ